MHEDYLGAGTDILVDGSVEYLNYFSILFFHIQYCVTSKSYYVLQYTLLHRFDCLVVLYNKNQMRKDGKLIQMKIQISNSIFLSFYTAARYFRNSNIVDSSSACRHTRKYLDYCKIKTKSLICMSWSLIL